MSVLNLRDALRVWVGPTEAQRLWIGGAQWAGGVSPITAISADGWQATYPSPPAFDPVSAPETVPVARQGFNAAAMPVTVNDALTIMDRVREPYPSQTLLTTDKVSLSDYVYAGDVVSGAVNSSARPAPLPIAAWIGYDREIVKTATYPAKLAVAHAHARNGRPVAAVKFIATDGVTTVEKTVSSMAVKTYAVTGLSVPHFAADLDLTGFANGSTITIDAVIYPWVGEAFTISTDGEPYPSPNLSTLRILCDRTGGYGGAYAYVDAVNGTASGVVSTDPTVAAATPYQTIVQASPALRAFNNTNFGRNFTDGGVIRLAPGVHVLENPIRVTGPTNGWPLTIEAASPSDRATTILTDRGTSMPSSIPDQTVYRDITLQRSQTGNITFLDNAAANLSYTSMMQFERCVFDGNGAGPYGPFVYKTGLCGYTECEQIEDAGQSIVTSAVNKAVRSIGCAGNFVNAPSSYGALGCAGRGIIRDSPPTAARPGAAGQLHGWSLITAVKAADKALEILTDTGPRGHAVVGCVLEQADSRIAPAVSFSADGNVTPQQNVVMQSCTAVGSRTNWLYQDIGSARVAKSGYYQGNVCFEFNVKTDVFGENENLTGNWSAIYNVGSRSNCATSGGSNGPLYGTGMWLGQIAAPGDIAGSVPEPIVTDWADDRSFFGTGTGGGDYTPGPLNGLPTIDAALTPYPVDMRGRAIPTDGTALAGAIQPL